MDKYRKNLTVLETQLIFLYGLSPLALHILNTHQKIGWIFAIETSQTAKFRYLPKTSEDKKRAT